MNEELDFVRIAAWNLNHRAREKPISPKVAKAVQEIAPDVLVLNEYVDGQSRQQLRADLEALGLVNQLVSERISGQNQVLIASRLPFEPGALRGPATQDGAGAANFLHVRLPSVNLDLIGIRVPWYTGKPLTFYWDLLMPLIEATRSKRAVWIGDLNADPERPINVGGRRLAALRSAGWQIPAADGQWSFPTGSRIDHALVASSLRVGSARYITTLNGQSMIGLQQPETASDHAALLLEVGV